MPFAAALSTAPLTNQALDEVCPLAAEQLGGPPDLAVIFFTPHHAGAAETIASTARQRLGARCLVGCMGESVIGGDREIEDGPAVSLWLAKWARPVEADSFHLEPEPTPDGFSLLGWPDGLTQADPARAAVLALGDPYTVPSDLIPKQLNEISPGLRVMGGMASGAPAPGRSRLLLDDRVLNGGVVGVLLRGPVGLRCIVSQGCRPVGRPFVITRAQDNVIFELGGKPALQQLQEVWQSLTPHDQELFRRGPHVGRVISEYRDTFQRGDFLIRNLMGLDRESGAVAISDLVRVGQTVQFHVRDADTADEDLHALLQIDLSAHERRPGGALVFSCNGRGTRLFGDDAPHHDAKTVRAEAGAIPLAGFFAQGELGPVGDQNFVHGFTASVALFED